PVCTHEWLVGAARTRVPDQGGDEAGHGAEGGAAARIVGPVALVVVAEVREIHERQGRTMPIDDEAGRISDPARRDEAGARAPELEEREWTQRAFQLVFEIVGLCVNAGK